jgi:hypothetical protein
MKREPYSGNNRSDLALIGRGITTTKAVKLRKEGYTLGKLQQMPKPDLEELGLNKLVIENILGSGRPPPPTANLIEVLYANKFMCCVCRKPKRGVIVHHIRKWAESRDHAVENLAVLCSLDHARVHTTSQLTRNLDPTTRATASVERGGSLSGHDGFHPLGFRQGELPVGRNPPNSKRAAACHLLAPSSGRRRP